MTGVHALQCLQTAYNLIHLCSCSTTISAQTYQMLQVQYFLLNWLCCPPSASAADRALSSSREREGRAADPAALATPSKETAVEIWLLAARCTAVKTPTTQISRACSHRHAALTACTYRADLTSEAVGCSMTFRRTRCWPGRLRSSGQGRYYLLLPVVVHVGTVAKNLIQ